MCAWKPTVRGLPLLFVFALIASAGPAVAQTGIGERFIAPTSDYVLHSVFTGALQGVTVGGDYAFMLHELDGWAITGTIFHQARTGPVAANQTVVVNTLLSDVDVLIEFEEGATAGLLRLSAMEIELGEILGRKADLRTANDLSRYFRDQVLRSAEVQYAA
jgi:hypothetical protein